MWEAAALAVRQWGEIKGIAVWEERNKTVITCRWHDCLLGKFKITKEKTLRTNKLLRPVCRTQVGIQNQSLYYTSIKEGIWGPDGVA